MSAEFINAPIFSYDMVSGFVVYPTYSVIDDKPVVQLIGRLETGETFRAEFDQEPFFYIRTSDVEAAKSVADVTIQDTEFTTFAGEAVSRVVVRIPKDVPALRREFEDVGVQCFEADIRFAYRFLIDNNITGSLVLDGEFEKGVRVDRVYKNPRVRPSHWSPELTVLSIDIETDKRAGQLWSVALATKGRVEKLIISSSDVSGARVCKTEKELLIALSEVIMDIDPDIITGWNVIDFDLKVLQEKYRQHEVSWEWGRLARDCSLRLMSEFFRDSSADIPGRMVLDGIQLLKSSFIRLDSFTLESAAQEFLGDGKLFTGKDRYQQIADAYENDPQLLLEYNLKDAQLVLAILDETGVIGLTIKRSLLTGMQLDRVKASIASLDMLYLPRLHARGVIAPTSGYVQKSEPITGGFVMESKPGVYDFVIVCDFKSLYPSIIRTLNIDPWAFKPDISAQSSDGQFVVAENGAVFSQETGILPGILQELWEAREDARKQGDELARFAIKILMNSFFGVLASPNCRFFSMEMANAITKTGQYVTKMAAEVIRDKGFEVIYGDTDSIFVNLAVDSLEESERIGERLASELNEFFSSHAKERYARESFLEMEYEKTFIRFLMPMTRGGEAAKKRYAGLRVKNGKEDVEFTGLEFVRRDWTDLSKEFQLGILERVFKKEDPQTFIREFVADLRSGNHDDLLVYRKALRKKLSEYTKTTPPHVKAARLMDEITSDVIEYVMTVDGPEPVSKQQHSVDYEHYVDKQLKPIADSILVFYNTSFGDVLKGSSQRGLFDF